MVSREAQFWLAAALYRLERYDDAENIVSDLIRRSFHYPNVALFIQNISKEGERNKKARNPLLKKSFGLKSNGAEVGTTQNILLRRTSSSYGNEIFCVLPKYPLLYPLSARVNTTLKNLTLFFHVSH